MVKKERKTKKVRRMPLGIVHIQASFNNTIITVSQQNGDVISWSSGGACGFKGARKGTPYAGQLAAEKASRESLDQGLKMVEVKISGAGAGRESALRAIQATGLGILRIHDVTPLPHNGCRPPKKRRV
uniref:Small ribosomal subunit protein uS11c n=1 Tax=Microrhizoidea pickettheapsiorum TaxID=2604950 RepID=A0A5B9RTS8_9CHLO|nr:ribosomal protein S11 [Microrhizoidea pickettheapsiorum]QEG77705.1 ribosomal protein S11 [Microrhizoidea pickettheapsiorum]